MQKQHQKGSYFGSTTKNQTSNQVAILFFYISHTLKHLHITFKNKVKRSVKIISKLIFVQQHKTQQQQQFNFVVIFSLYAKLKEK